MLLRWLRIDATVHGVPQFVPGLVLPGSQGKIVGEAAMAAPRQDLPARFGDSLRPLPEVPQIIADSPHFLAHLSDSS